MSVSDADIAYAIDLFSSLGALSWRKMMGGLTIYCEDQIFSLVNGDGVIYLKASGEFADAMAEMGARQFTYVNKTGKSARMGYWTLPEDALDDPDLACDWAKRALLAL